MNTFKHFSFDLWSTLIKSNPKFKKERALYFYKNYNTKNKNFRNVENIFRKVDLMCNGINEKTGGNIPAEEMYLMVLYELNDDKELFEVIDLNELYNHLEQLFFCYSPIVFDFYTIETLEKIKQTPETTLSILSNTAFIKGSTLRILLKNLKIAKYFDFQIYSDEVKLSKPNPYIFKHLIDNVSLFRNGASLLNNQIIHIGDNIIADIRGANFIGINSMQINSNDKNIQHILNND